MSIIKTDMAKAKEIHKAHIRSARAPKLAEKDIEFQRAIETGASTTDIVASKQAGIRAYWVIVRTHKYLKSR
jgi:hypothetical protein